MRIGGDDASGRRRRVSLLARGTDEDRRAAPFGSTREGRAVGALGSRLEDETADDDAGSCGRAVERKANPRKSREQYLSSDFYIPQLGPCLFHWKIAQNRNFSRLAVFFRVRLDFGPYSQITRTWRATVHSEKLL
jgi:hypothetical protein